MRRRKERFTPYLELMTEANIFINHKDARDYFYYRTEFTIKDVLVNVPNKSDELEMIRMDLTMYADELLTQLESFEEYEMCREVKEAMRQYYHQIFKLQQDLEKLDK